MEFLERAICNKVEVKVQNKKTWPSEHLRNFLWRKYFVFLLEELSKARRRKLFLECQGFVNIVRWHNCGQ